MNTQESNTPKGMSFRSAGLLPAFRVGEGEKVRWTKGASEVKTLCKTFNADWDKTRDLMIERYRTGMSVAQAISWAKEQVMQKKAPQLPKARKPYDPETSIPLADALGV